MLANGSDRPEVDAGRIGLVGALKGAEFSLIGASQFPWVKAVVACVPSDVVWAGYGREAAPGEKLSSWSLNGKPFPFIAYDHYEDVFAGKATAAEVHGRSREKATATEIAAARIPVERIRGHILLFGAGKDEVWPSETMVENIARELRDAGHSKQFQLHPSAERTAYLSPAIHCWVGIIEKSRVGFRACGKTRGFG